MTGSGSSCGACKFLRRKCTCDCVFAPYFSYDQASAHFAAVHKVFGASNVSKLLSHLPVQARSDAAVTISYEALARMRDPVYGCVAHIFALQEQVANLQEEIEILGTQMANLGVGFQSGRADQFHDNITSTFCEIPVHFTETNNHGDKSHLFCQNHQEDHLHQLAATNTMMINAEFHGMCAWGGAKDPDQDQDQDHNLSSEDDPNLMDKIFDATEPGTCMPSYPWIANNVCD
ncbi:hypothetical protein MLD38_002636 [Melastoma candidum]|uniref:Uncharacterized protein n=1 Tax=Melastoma candidum TaxID=119954 RepID=A0ACB9S315_9MYRT|nr:hypothetical protein MLD38_002636 [Melastoma candidum]